MIMAILVSVILLFAGIGILILIHFCIVGRAFRRGFGGDTNAAAESGSLRSASMSRDDVEKLPCFDFQSREKGSSPVDCAVCLDNLKAGDKCRLLPQCRHSFHAECVDLWLLRTPICPICRTSADLNSTQFAENDQFNYSAEIVIRDSQDVAENSESTAGQAVESTTPHNSSEPVQD